VAINDSNMRASVIIPCYNSSTFLPKTLECVLAQSMQPLEIICVDDASTDDTWDLLQDFASKTQNMVIPLRHDVNRGTPAAGRNTAITRACGDWVAFLDHDDEWMPDKLETQARMLLHHPDSGLIHSDAWSEREGEQGSRRPMQQGRHIPAGDPFRALFHRNFIVCSTVLIRRDWLGKAGRLNEAPEALGVDDYDLWLRLARLRCPFTHVAEPLATWQYHGDNASQDKIMSLSSKIWALENLLCKEHGMAVDLGGRGIDLRLTSLRLELAHALLQAGKVNPAQICIEKVLDRKGLNQVLWSVRMAMTLHGLMHPGTQKTIRKAGRRYRQRSRAEGQKKS
jgi:glycosyltransferase involved in cell wall biosynthesis